MKPLLLLAAPFALAGCATLFGPTNPYAVDRKGELVEFNYAWSAEASAVPVLVRRLQADLETLFKAATTRAQADRAAATAADRRFVGHQFNRRWTTAGQSARLLSLQGATAISTGGARASNGTVGLIWDRLARREVKPARLFGTTERFDKLVGASSCPTVAAARAAPVAACPGLGEMTVIPVDSDADRRFDRFRLVSPHGADGGPADGRQDLIVPVTAQIRAALRPAYRSSFAVQPQ